MIVTLGSFGPSHTSPRGPGSIREARFASWAKASSVSRGKSAAAPMAMPVSFKVSRRVIMMSTGSARRSDPCGLR